MARPWILKNGISETVVQDLRRALNDLPVALARALALRGVQSLDQARAYFRAGMEASHDPFLMTDMAEAARRLARAVRDRERVVVYGDYDVDGTTSTALLTDVLRARKVPATYFIPDRMRHGYGLSPAGIDEAARSGSSLLVALDCGVTAVQEIAYARTLGLDVIVCDHHTCPDELPSASAILNPKRVDCDYPFAELCGCGVTFKLVQALLAELGEDPAGADQYLDLVALATTSDIVEVSGENRLLLRAGLRKLREDPRLGISALADESGTRLSDCSTRSILFSIGPRINAAGRLGDARRAVQLMLAHEPHVAAARARQLERVNRERRALDRAMLDDAKARAEQFLAANGDVGIVLFDPSWHLGVVGIVASRLVDAFHRPTILLSEVSGMAKGSARSVMGVNVFNAIAACAPLLEAFGGHNYAAGLTVRPENIPAFTEQFLGALSDATDGDIPEAAVELDAHLALDDIDGRFWAVLRQFEPFGPGNEPPTFHSTELEAVGGPSVVGKDGTHLKFRVRQSDSRSFDVIAFGMAKHRDLVAESARGGTRLELAYHVEENAWQGQKSLQLQAQDIRPQSD